MRNSKIWLLGLLIFQYHILYGQQFSGETNTVYFNTRNVNSATVKLPLITWLSPEQLNASVQGDSIELIARVYSSTMLKSLQLIQSGEAEMKQQYSLIEIGFSGEQIIKKKIRLKNGNNSFELIAENASGGKVSSARFVKANSTETVKIVPSKKIATPLLFVKENSVVFKDSDNDGSLNANEEAYVKFILGNKGALAGKDLRISYALEGNERSILIEPGPIMRLEPGKEIEISTRITAGQSLETGKVLLSLVVMEPNGFDSDPVQIQFNTEAYKPPMISITDAIFNSVASNKLERNKTTGLQLLVQNTGFGTAEGVKVNVDFPENIYFIGDRVIDLGTLSSGEAKKVDVEFIVTSRYKTNEVPIKITLLEKLGKHGSEKTVTAVLDQPLTAVQLNVVSEKPKGAIVPLLLRSTVDSNIPVNNATHSNRYALVIGNEDYSQFQPGLQVEQNVAFAKNDANVFKEYLVKTLGVPQQNVYLLLDATRGQINRELERVSELAKLNSNSELIFYYAGHGLPDFETRKGYLIPVDVSGSNIRDGISLSDLYKKLAATKAARITVFLDACFSGGGRGENGLLAARTVKVKPTGDLVDGNIIVFTASSGEEVSLPLKKESHGLFTYHVLRKFQETNGNVTMQEMQNYLSYQVPKSSLTENGMKQTPQVLTSPKLDLNWLNWKF